MSEVVSKKVEDRLWRIWKILEFMKADLFIAIHQHDTDKFFACVKEYLAMIEAELEQIWRETV